MKLKRDQQTIRAARQMFAGSLFLGPQVVERMSDDQVLDYAEQFLEQLQAALPGITEAARKMGEAWGDAARKFSRFSAASSP